jgi:hypothetical protein
MGSAPVSRRTTSVALTIAVFVAIAATSGSLAGAAPPTTVTGSGTFGLGHFFDASSDAIVKSNANWLWIDARKQLVHVFGGVLSYDTDLSPIIETARQEIKRDLRDLSGSLSVTIFVSRRPWPLRACGYPASLGDPNLPNLEFIIKGGTKSATEPMTGTIRSTHNSDVRFRGTWVSASGVGFGGLIDYTIEITC